MDLRQYLRVLRTHWVLIVVTVVACTAAAAAVAWTRDPVYAASTQLFVSTDAAAADPSQTYQGGLFSQQRVRSYAKIVSTPPVARAVIDQLGLSHSVQEVQDSISASVPTDTVLINVRVEDRSPRIATEMADAVADQFPKFVNTLEAPQSGRRSPVKVSVTSPAREPTDPASPNKPAYLALGALLGLIFGTSGAFLREALDSRVRQGRDAAVALGAPIIGRIARNRDAGKHPLVMADDPFSTGAEAFRLLRTNVRALTVDHGVKSLVVTSALPSEGKTSVTANLGVAFAQAGYHVVLVDADLRQPRLAQMLGVDAPEGLSDVLTGMVPIEQVLQGYPRFTLEVVPSGPPPPNPSELLGSKRFAATLQTLTNRADLVILDTPALLPVTDAAVLARLASAVLMVTRFSSTHLDHLETAAGALHAVERRVLGIVLNGLPSRDGKPYGDYGIARPEA